MSFVVTQSSLDLDILNYIRDNLGFGKVIQQSIKQNTHRFIVQDIKNIHLICLLFNEKKFFFLVLSFYSNRIEAKPVGKYFISYKSCTYFINYNLNFILLFIFL